MSVEEKGSGPGSALVEAVNATGAPATIKARVQKAILRLILGSVHPDKIERLRSNASTVEGRSRIDAMVAEEIGRQAIADPVFMERAKARFLNDLAQKQENIEAVAAKAESKLSDASDAEAIVAPEHPEPSSDWMHVFSRVAESASSEELRDRLASVLAGEARKPGSFSRATVRLIAELERELLETFQNVLEHKVDDAIIRANGWNEGDWFSKAVTLEDAGLISGSSGFTQRTIKLDDRGIGFFLGERHSLVVEGDVGTRKEVGIWLLTQTGREVARLLPFYDERPSLRRIGVDLSKSQLTRIYLGRTSRHLDGQFRVQMDEVLWTNNADQVVSNGSPITS